MFKWINKLLGPDNDFIAEILTILDKRSGLSHKQISDLFKVEPSFAKLQTYLFRLTEKGYIRVNRVMLTNPSRPAYILTDEGRKHLESLK